MPLTLITNHYHWQQTLSECASNGHIAVLIASASYDTSFHTHDLPKIRALADRHAAVKFYIFDVEDASDLAGALDIEALPKFFFFEGKGKGEKEADCFESYAGRNLRFVWDVVQGRL